MNNRRRRIAKATRKINRLVEELRPEGCANVEARRSKIRRILALHRHLGRYFYAPAWY
jgi:hypothetical protein